MLILLICWFLFVQPILLAWAYILGAKLYAMGQHQQVPNVMPRFSLSRRSDNGQQQQQPSRLPEV